MTPSQIKTKELVDKHGKIIGKKLKNGGFRYNIEIAKQCALIAVNRTINILKEMQEKEHSDNFWYLENAILDEQEIKTEIENL